MTLKDLRKQDIIKAADWIDKNGVPRRRWPTKYLVVIGDKEYPPKYAISIAHIFARGHELSHDIFYGGAPSNSRLRNLGFEIVEFSSIEHIRGKWRLPGR